MNSLASSVLSLGYLLKNVSMDGFSYYVSKVLDVFLS